MILYKQKISNFNYPTQHFKNYLKTKPQYGSNQAGQKRISQEEARYIRITDIDKYGNLKDNLGATAQKVETKYILNDNDLLFARSGATVGKAYLHKQKNVDYSCFFAGYMIRFIVDENKLLSDYVFCYTQLPVYKEWINAIQRAAGQPNINAEEYKSLLIPLPPLEKQKEIVTLFHSAYQQKQEKEAEAKRLLESIDAYLLEKLGIELPKQKETKKIFFTSLKEIHSKRFDPFYLLNCIDIPKSKIYQEISLRELAIINKGQSITKASISEGKYPVIAGGKTSPYSHSEYNYEGNIITVSASGAYSGYVWYHKKNIFASDCSVIFSKEEEKVTTIFLFEVLKMKQREIYNLQQGSGQPHVYPSDLAKIKIPLPTLKIQNEIANYISDLRNRAKELEKDAKAILKSAKKEVEKMILGE
jgi:restriction endonuclease S subunit